MKRNFLLILVVIILCQACAPGRPAVRPANQASVVPEGQGRCGDGVCDGPEDGKTCPADCQTGMAEAQEPQENGTAKKTPAAEPSTEYAIGVVDAEIQVDRSPGLGTCGVEPWYSPDCTMNTKVWWELHLSARASTPVLIVPDGQDRWVITSQKSAASKYGVDLADYKYLPFTGEYTRVSINPAATNPECSADISAPDFDFQVLGTREEGLTNLTLSANPVELIEGSCGQAKFSYETEYLLYDWAYALTGDAGQLSFQMNDTFHTDTGTSVYRVTLDANPSPEKRDHITSELSITCMGQISSGVRAPVACPWEK